jgi:hypothetical protein
MLFTLKYLLLEVLLSWNFLIPVYYFIVVSLAFNLTACMSILHLMHLFSDTLQHCFSCRH